MPKMKASRLKNVDPPPLTQKLKVPQKHEKDLVLGTYKKLT